MRRTLLIGPLCLCSAVSGCADHKSGSGDHNVTYEITANGLTGKVKINYLSHMDQNSPNRKVNSRRSSDYAAVPYTKEVALGDYWDRAHIYARAASSKDSKATLTCTIKHDGTVVATKTGNQSVSCDAPRGAADESK
ncbi:hypothetical protein [Segniliparus rugosus]|uniref:Lipoprotein n=1 Tax=Segniliparus rugosus (strain ATCC BAA-974 / DSM 45345 / CCUG 50838 / CIP 108380 / JCM 13579 / CDC 945) TaxID=679197 RepID=E5XR20_SEGRC|nr:hypothetical protein [Segniliparus rugosus]EFV13213.1 hypothetical protein HMPREF9336_01942 [Segniliparus rugosus ATCC BAA-974]